MPQSVMAFRSQHWDCSQSFMKPWGFLAKLSMKFSWVFSWLMVSVVSRILLSRAAISWWLAVGSKKELIYVFKVSSTSTSMPYQAVFFWSFGSTLMAGLIMIGLGGISKSWSCWGFLRISFAETQISSKATCHKWHTPAYEGPASLWVLMYCHRAWVITGHMGHWV